MARERPKTPSWDRLFEIASQQEGLFTTGQASDAGYSRALLAHHVRSGRLARVRRGIYRVVHFKPGPNADFVAAWLWSERRGVISHQTALGLLGIADLLRWPIHLTLPEAWRSRRLQVPSDVAVHFADVTGSDRTWRGPVPVTSARRTFADGATDSLSPKALREALDRALEGAMITRSDVADLELDVALTPPRRSRAKPRPKR